MAQKPAIRTVVNRAFQVKPLIEQQGGRGKTILHWLAPLDVFKDSLMDELQTAGEAKGLKEIGTFDVAIPTGFRSWPQPKQFQILPHIPKDLMKDAVAFKVNFPRPSSGEDGEEIATVTVYKGPVPDDIKRQPVRAHGKDYKARLPVAQRPAGTRAPAFNDAAQPGPAPQPAAVPAPETLDTPPPATFTKKPPLHF